MHVDKLADVYHGRTGTEEFRQRTRARVHWICNKVTGTDVLDVGCSGGVVCILLGREGFQVTGIDRELEAIEAANKELEAEDQRIRESIRFVWASGAEIPFPPASFDTVILGEVIEHLIQPERLLDDVRRVLRPGGSVIITTPYGLDRTPDHKDPLYIRRIRELLSPDLRITDIELVDPWLTLVATLGAPSGVDDGRLLQVAEERVAKLDLQIAEQHRKIRELGEQRGQLRDRVDDLKARLAESKEKLAAQREVSKKVEMQLAAFQLRQSRRLTSKVRRAAKRLAR